MAETMPSDFYLEENFFNMTINNIFVNAWQFLTHDDLIDDGIMPFDFLKDSIDESLLIVKNNNNIKCFSNVCTHRGNILCNKNTDAKIIKCSYHGRTFDLNGKFKSMPGFKEVQNFPSSSDSLKEMKINNWYKFIFGSIGKGIEIDSILNDISNRLVEYPLNKLHYDKSKSTEYILDFHWALYCENYLEGFHIPYVHKGLKSDINFDSYKTEIIKNGVLQYTLENNRKNIYAYYYWIFPNMMFNFYDWGLSINIIEPIAREKTRIRFLSFPIKGKTQPINTESSLEKVESEDQLIVKKVQKGIKSRFYNRGRYSVKHEKGVHYFHRLLAEHLN